MDTDPTKPSEVNEADLPAADETELTPVPKRSRIKSALKRMTVTKKRRVIAVIGAILVVMVVLLAIPVTRYALLGLAIKKDVSVTVKDGTTGRPVSDASVRLGSYSAMTDKNGKAVLRHVPVGNYALSFSKKYYASSDAPYVVPVLTNPVAAERSLKANGRPVAFKVLNPIDGTVVSGATLKVGGTSATTDASGTALVVVADKSGQTGTISKSGYGDASVTLDTNGDETKNTFTLTPSGSLVYLNNANGTIDVVRSDLDGSGRAIIVAGTGSEDRFSTSLLSSRDWKYSALKARRDGANESMYLVTTADGSLANIDEGDASFTSIGWSGHLFFYTVNRNVTQWSDKASALKMYNADTKKLATLDETTGSGTAYYDATYQYFSQVYIVDGQIVYLKPWVIAQSAFWYGQDPGKSATLIAIDVSTGKKRTVKEFSQNAPYINLSLALYEPQGVYVFDNSNGAYYEYEDGDLKTIEMPTVSDQYPTFLISPSGNKTFWYELRNGKNTIFIGDKDGKNPRQIATLSEYVPYGWFGDNDQYILFSKNGSELYIASADKPIGATPLKITDYYKVQTYPGYGYGYGGQ